MKVVAEGVESIQQLQLLEVYQCDMVQEYGYSKPVSLKDFESKALYYMNL